MNSTTAKQIDLVDFLVRINAREGSTKGSDVWFFSPLRDDGKEPSFKVNTTKNIWFDHGEGVGGTIIDLVMQLENIKDVQKALERIDEIWNGGAALTAVEKERIQKIKSAATGDKKEIKIKKVVELKNDALIKYLESRNLSFSLAKPYVKEIYYSISDGETLKNYFGLAFENQSGGFEVRNAYAKMCIGEKDITLIPGKDHTKVSIFEGFLSFVSMLKILNIPEFSGDVIVMNSVNMKQRTVELIEQKGYKTIYTFSDNDRAGQAANEYIYFMLYFFDFIRGKELKSDFFDSRKLFAGYKDPNDLLMGNPITSKA